MGEYRLPLAAFVLFWGGVFLAVDLGLSPLRIFGFCLVALAVLVALALASKGDAQEYDEGWHIIKFPPDTITATWLAEAPESDDMRAFTSPDKRWDAILFANGEVAISRFDADHRLIESVFISNLNEYTDRLVGLRALDRVLREEAAREG